MESVNESPSHYHRYLSVTVNPPEAGQAQVSGPWLAEVLFKALGGGQAVCSSGLMFL